MKTVLRDIFIVNRFGLHARPSAEFSKIARKFSSDIFVELDGVKASGKSAMELMTLDASYGKVIRVTCKGEDSEEQMNAIEDVVKNFIAGE